MFRSDQKIIIGYFMIPIFLVILMGLIPNEIGLIQYVGFAVSVFGVFCIARSKWQDSVSRFWLVLGPPTEAKKRKIYFLGYTFFVMGFLIILIRF